MDSKRRYPVSWPKTIRASPNISYNKPVVFFPAYWQFFKKEDGQERWWLNCESRGCWPHSPGGESSKYGNGATNEEECLPNQSSVSGTDPVVGCDLVSTLHTVSFLNGGQILANAPVSKGDMFLGKSTVLLIKFWSERFGPVWRWWSFVLIVMFENLII